MKTAPDVSISRNFKSLAFNSQQIRKTHQPTFLICEIILRFQDNFLRLFLNQIGKLKIKKDSVVEKLKRKIPPTYQQS